MALGGSKQKKMNARVDFTPMVDMIMLLVTFFMLCTTLLKPQTMEIAMPSDKEDVKDEDRSQIAESKAVTIMVDKDRQVYYFKGKPSADNLDKATLDPGKESIHNVLKETNAEALQKVAKLRAEYQNKTTQNVGAELKMKEEFQNKLDEIRDGDDTPSVIIKPSEEISYQDLIDILDEMNLCSIGKYVIDKFTPADKAKIEAKFGSGAK